MKHRSWIYTIGFLAAWLSIVLAPWLKSTYFGGNWHHEWGTLGVPAMLPIFADLRGITHAADCWEHGSALYEANPCSPFGLKYNYPRYLLYLHFLGVSGASTEFIGISMIFLFLCAVGYLVRKANIPEAIYWWYLCTSMPVVLAIERGNHDMLVFVFVVLFLFLSARNTMSAYGSLFLATILKLFPLFTFSVALREPWKRSLQIATVLGAATGLLFYLSWDDIQRIQAATPDSPVYSYGLRRLSPSLALLIASGEKQWFFTIGTIVLLTLFGAYQITRRSLHAPHSQWTIDAFRLGASVLVGTWFLSVHFCYRLIFVLLLVPFLTTSLRGRLGEKLLGSLGLLLVATSLRFESVERFTKIGLDEVSVSLLAILALVLFLLTTPFKNSRFQGSIR